MYEAQWQKNYWTFSGSRIRTLAAVIANLLDQSAQHPAHPFLFNFIYSSSTGEHSPPV
jgi:hypothetical protein